LLAKRKRKEKKIFIICETERDILKKIVFRKKNIIKHTKKKVQKKIIKIFF
jgi:hypothetical protein